MRRPVFCLLVIVLPARADAAFERLGVSPLSQGVAATASLSLWSPWSVLENSATCSGARTPWVLTAISPSPFGLPELSAARVGLILPTRPGSVVLDLSTSGFSLYRESALTAGWAIRIADNFDAGVRATLFALSIAGYGSGYAAGLDLGVCWWPVPIVCLGWTATRLNAPVLAPFHERLPTAMGFGCAVTPLPWSELSFDIRQEADVPTECRFGCSLQLHDALNIRLAITNNPSELTWGADLSLSPVVMSYRLTIHPALGVIHTIGLCLRTEG